MGACSSQSEKHKSQPSKLSQKVIKTSSEKIITNNKPINDETKIEKPQQNIIIKESSPVHSQHSQHSQKSLQLSGNDDKRKSVQSHQSKMAERPSKLKNVRCNSSRSLQSPGSPGSARGSIQQGVHFFSTNASKKYSVLAHKDNQTNNITFVENNKTGKRARLEILPKSEEDSIKYIYWLKSNQLDHQNILKNLEVHQDNDGYQLIHEDFQGIPLSRLQTSDELSEKVFANIADQMLSVLSHLKSLNMIHCCLTINSWEYRFVSGQIHIKLIDVKSISVKKPLDIEMAHLISPDQIYRDDIKAEKDLWAVMMILYIFAKGDLPYPIPYKQQTDLTSVKQVILNHRFDIESDITKYSQQFKNFLAKVIGERSAKKRKKIEEIIDDEWLIKNRYPDILIQERLLMNILNQKGICMLQQAIIEIMIQEFEQETAIQLQKMVSEFDSDMDTQLTKEEFIQLFQKYTKVTDLEDKINIIYNENGIKDDLIPQFTFLALAAPRDQLINRFNLEIVFNLLSNNKPEIRASNVTKYLNVQNEELEAQFNDLAPEKKLNLNQFIKMMELVK